MRKLISLLLALTLIVSMGAFSISASAAGVNYSVSQNTSTSTGLSTSTRMYVGAKYMPALIYNEAGAGRAKVAVNAFNYGANYVTVKILNKSYAATTTSRYYRGGYYYTNLRVRIYSYDLGRTAGVVSYNAFTELNITIRSRTYRFSGT